MMECPICIHTSDKKYTTQYHKIANSEFLDESVRHNTLALNNSVWASDTIYWRRDSSYEWIDDETMDKMIKASLLESSMHTNLKIQQRNRSTSDAHIVIDWVGKKDDKYFTSDGILAYAYGPGRSLGGNVVMNSDVLWLLRKEKLTAKEAKEKGYIDNYSDPTNFIKFFDPLHTMKHEAGGHALGMRHITDINQSGKAIMYPYYNGLREFGEMDIQYIQQLYGEASLSKTIIDMIRMRINNF